ncbi:MAG: tetratricopeptide repeat protein [Planctomycetaceae bacterium]
MKMFTEAKSMFAEANVNAGLDYARNQMSLATCEYLFGDINSSEEHLAESMRIRDHELLALPNGRSEMRDLAFCKFLQATICIEREEFSEAQRQLSDISALDLSAAPELPMLVAFADLVSVATAAYELKAGGRPLWTAIPDLLRVATSIHRHQVNSPIFVQLPGLLVSEATYILGGPSPYPVYQQLHAEITAEIGETHFLSMFSLFPMALAASRTGNHQAACEHFEESIETSANQLGRKHLRFAMLLHHYGRILVQNYEKKQPGNRDDLWRAHGFLKEATELRREKLADHRLAALSTYWLARTESHLGHHNEAARHHADAAAMRKNLYGEIHHSMSDSFTQLAIVSRSLNDREKADEYERKCAAINTSLLMDQLTDGLTAFLGLLSFHFMVY